MMKWLVSKAAPGPELWKHFVEQQCLGIAEIVLLFRSCAPSLPQLVEILKPLPPRFYSIACSPLVHPTAVSVAFTVVRYVCGVQAATGSSTTPSVSETGGESGNSNGSDLNAAVQVSESCVEGSGFIPEENRIYRSGLCTSYLEGILSPWLIENGSEVTDTSAEGSPRRIRIFMKPTSCFYLPSSLQSPLVLIGPGTGVAPFVGFLEHRSSLVKNHSKYNGCAEVCTGVWRGGFEMSGEGLPLESTHVSLDLYQRVQEKQRGEVWLFFGCRDESDYLYEVRWYGEGQSGGTLFIHDVHIVEANTHSPFHTPSLVRPASLFPLHVKSIHKSTLRLLSIHEERDCNSYSAGT